MRYVFMVIMTVFLFMGTVAVANDTYEMPNVITDTYQIDFGPLIEAFPGETDLLVPVWARVSQPTVGINLLMAYDPSLLTPLYIVPNMFFQDFDVDHTYPGRITINILTDLPPPPQVPPVEGDTIIAWIQCRVTSDDIGYDLLTHFVFFDDPITPYPDNNLWLEGGGWVAPPALSLIQGDILIISPLYGDINVNGFAFEIGDAITFLNFFMGNIEFTRRQYANSDCNRDGLQATIADLVYLMGVVSGDTLLGASEIPETVFSIGNCGENHAGKNRLFELDSRSSFSVNVQCLESLGGAYFNIEFDPRDIQIESVILNQSAENLDLNWAVDNGTLMVAVFDWQGIGSSFNGGDLFTVCYNGFAGFGMDAFDVARADFSDSQGYELDADYHLSQSDKTYLITPKDTGISLSAYPNPFNGFVTISYELPRDGNYDLVVFDILGREVKTLIDSYKSSGGGVITWDGTNNLGNDIASGIYFARLRGETVSANIKLFLMK